MEGNTKLRKHEVIVLAIVGSNCDEIDQIVKTATQGHVLKPVERVENKRLAYEIRGNEYATYLYYKVEMTREMVRELNSKLTLCDSVLRFLIVRDESRADEAKEKFEKMVSERRISARIYFRVLKLAYCYITGEERAGTSAEITQKMRELAEQSTHKAANIYECAARIVNAL